MNKLIKISIVAIIFILYFAYLLYFEDNKLMGMRQWLLLVLLEFPAGLIIHYLTEKK
jgi:hypothetical protein